MFKQFRHIGDYHIYRNWSGSRGAAPFEQVNLIFGTNGSGKSTLAQLLQDCVDGVLPAATDIRFEWQADGLPLEYIVDDRHDAWRRVHVFNKSYVSRSLRFEGPDGPSPDALLTLGEANVNAQAELEEKRARSKDLTSSRADLRNRILQTRKHRDDKMRSAAQDVVNRLSGTDRRYRASNVYNITQVRALLEHASTLAGASTDARADQMVVDSAPLAAIERPNRPNLAAQADMTAIVELLDERVTATAIDALTEHGDRAEWVQTGLELHDGLARCLFCDGELGPERRDALEAHFDSAVEDLQRRIDLAIRRLATSVADAAQYAFALPRRQELYEDAAEAFDLARDGYHSDLATYQDAVQNLDELLRAKRSNPFGTPLLPKDLCLEPPTTEHIEAALGVHGSRSRSHSENVRGAARRLELHIVAGVADEVHIAASEIEAAELELAQLDQEQRETDGRIVALTDLEADPTPLAAELTASIARLLGRDELLFAPGPDRRTYRLERAGAPATALSEGERTCIALIHFLARLRSSEVVDTLPIVVVDDPVSSLDHNVMFGVSSHLWAELVSRPAIAQTFVLTHSFEMFRQWLIQLDSAGRFAPRSSVHELHIRNREVDGEPRRVPTFVKWPHKDNRKAKTLRSQYHYLFGHVGQAVSDAANGGGLMAQLDALALAPNSARRMLEAFLAFRYPAKVGSFDGALREALANIEDGPVRTRVLRYLHSYSHNEDADISRPLEPGEAIAVLQAVFALMQTLDPQHYAAMCEVLGLDASVLCGIATPSFAA